VEYGKGDFKWAATLAGIALILDVVSLLLPLHFLAPGQFGNAFPGGVGIRLTIGFLIQDFTLALMIAAGLVLLARGRQLITAGVFLAAGIYSVLRGASAPFYALPRLQPMVLMTLRISVGILLFLAAWRCTRPSPTTPPLPPPP
jgi:hypothetical protein